MEHVIRTVLRKAFVYSLVGGGRSVQNKKLILDAAPFFKIVWEMENRRGRTKLLFHEKCLRDACRFHNAFMIDLHANTRPLTLSGHLLSGAPYNHAPESQDQ